MAIIFYLSTASPSTFPKVTEIKYLDKMVHILMYFGLSLVLVLEIPRKKSYGYYFFTILLPILYGGLIEIIQENFFSPRTGNIFDFLADTVGVLTGYFVAIGLLNIKNKKVKY